MESNKVAAEHEFVARLRAREKKSFDELYSMYAPSLLRRLYRLTGNPIDAEDCLQQVFTEVLESIHQYRGEGVLGAWINRIATNVAIGMFRKKSRWQSLKERIWSEPQSITNESYALPERLFLKKESQDMVHTLLEKLSPNKRMAILLCDIEGWTQEEAAKHLQIPLGTLVSRVYHGRKELRSFLERESQRQGLSIEDILYE